MTRLKNRLTRNPKFRGKESIEIIQGLSLNSKYITLYNCIESSFTFSIDKNDIIWKTIFWVQTIIVGDFYTKKLDQIEIRDVSIELSHIGQWVNAFTIGKFNDFTIGESYFETSSKEQKYLINNELEIIHQVIPLINESSIKGNINKLSVEQKSVFKIIFSAKRTWKDYYNIVMMLRNLFCLLLHEPISILSITFTTENSWLKDGSNVIYPEIELHFALAISQDFILKLKDRYLVNYNEISSNLHQTIRNWITNYEEMRPIYELFFNSFFNKHMFLYHTFLSMIQGIESLHRKKFKDMKPLTDEEFIEVKKAISNLELNEAQKKVINSKLEYANEINLRKRLNHLLLKELFNLDLFPNKTSVNSFINKVMNTRNYLTHYDESLKSETASEDTLREITDKLNLILYFWILKIVGLDQNYSKKGFNQILEI